MIKKSCLSFLIVVTQIQVATGEGHGATVEKAMTPKMAHTLFTEAFNAKNAEQLCALFAKDAVAVNPRREGRAAICESMKTEGVSTVRTMIAREDNLNMSFFRSQGISILNPQTEYFDKNTR